MFCSFPKYDKDMNVICKTCGEKMELVGSLHIFSGGSRDSYKCPNGHCEEYGDESIPDNHPFKGRRF